MRLEPALTCQEVVELVTAYLDDALTPGERERFEQHLASCAGCRTYLEQMQQSIAATGRIPLVLPPELEARLLDAFRDWRAAGQ